MARMLQLGTLGTLAPELHKHYWTSTDHVFERLLTFPDFKPEEDIIGKQFDVIKGQDIFNVMIKECGGKRQSFQTGCPTQSVQMI